MRKPASAAAPIHITNLDLDGKGIGHNAAGKVVFVEGALPTETVRYATYRSKNNWEAATLSEVLVAANLRTTPRCPHFDLCGGCVLQHLDANAQVALKARFLEDSLWHIAKVKPDTLLPAIHGPYWNYRHKARLAVRWVEKKNKLLIGFHEKKSSFVADMSECHTLHPRVADRLPLLRELIGGLSIMRDIPQIEVAVSEVATAFALRILAPLASADEARLIAFAQTASRANDEVQIWLQPGNPSTLAPLYPPQAQLSYRLSESGIDIQFLPNDFTQVNHQMNDVLVARALRLLQLDADDQVLDLFCGLGNFSLPIAQQVQTVLGVEGAMSLVQRASANSAAHHLAERARFVTHNLFTISYADFWHLGRFNKCLIDPPRDGAATVCQHLQRAHAEGHFLPQRIVYVSCNPATLARDSGTLVHGAGYRLAAAGIMNMFPHTAHVESIAVFTRGAVGESPLP